MRIFTLIVALFIMATGAIAQISPYGDDRGLVTEGQDENTIEVYSVEQYIYVRFDFEYDFATIMVYDFLGKQLMREQVEETTNFKMPESLNQGYYIVKILVNNEVYTKKIYVN